MRRQLLEGLQVEFPSIPPDEMQALVQNAINVAVQQNPKDPASWLQRHQVMSSKAVLVAHMAIKIISQAKREEQAEVIKRRFEWSPGE